MRRWQVTAGLVVLAGVGVILATLVPDVDDAPGRAEPLPTVSEVTPIGTVAEPPPSTIPELSEPIRPIPRVVLPPDPEPVRYGCGGPPVHADAPLPACGMG